MAWTAPMTATLNQTFTAAQYNANVRDNLKETEAYKAANIGRLFFGTGTNAIAERATGGSYITTLQTTASTTYTDLKYSGPAVTITTGTAALVWWSCGMGNNTANTLAACSIAVSGATTTSASDTWMLSFDGHSAGSSSPDNLAKRGVAHMFTGLTAGANTFKMVYRVGGGTGYFANRDITVMAL